MLSFNIHHFASNWLPAFRLFAQTLICTSVYVPADNPVLFTPDPNSINYDLSDRCELAPHNKREEIGVSLRFYEIFQKEKSKGIEFLWDRMGFTERRNYDGFPVGAGIYLKPAETARIQTKSRKSHEL